jgi:hypothetical protein
MCRLAAKFFSSGDVSQVEGVVCCHWSRNSPVGRKKNNFVKTLCWMTEPGFIDITLQRKNGPYSVS